MATIARRRPAAVARPRRAARSRPGFAAQDLIVAFRPTALGAPPLGSAALATAAGAPLLARAIRTRLAAIVPAGAAITGVSPAILTARVRIADTTQREAIAAALRRDPGVAAVTRNHLIWLDKEFRAVTGSSRASGILSRRPNDELYPFQSWNYGLIDLPRAWAITTGQASVLVAVVDDGIRRDHPAITANLTSDGFDFVNAADSLKLCAGGKITNQDDGDAGPDPDPTIPASFSLDSTGTCYKPDDFGGHGLHVAGTIGEVGNDGIGATGVNWTVSIRPVRALGVGGFGSDYDIAQGILYAAGLPADGGALGTVRAGSAAKIINLSLGGPDNDSTLHAAIVMAANAGVFIVAAAGNGSSSAPSYPAAYPEVLAVAAVGPDGFPAPYSSFGADVAIRAPGGNFAFGDATDGVLSTMWEFVASGGIPVGPVYAWAEGTSMAAPHVSGVAALLLAQTPSLAASDLRSRLTNYSVGPATAYGAGLVNAYNSLTQTHGPSIQLYARLYSAVTGDTVQTVPADASGAFAFRDVEDGIYLVYAGTDEAADQRLGIPGRLWGAFGGLAAPGRVTVFGAGAHAASFSIGFPAEVEPNHTISGANLLAIGGYAQGVIVDTLTPDVYRVLIPAAGSYTFQTSGWVADCGIALEEATAVGLYDGNGSLITGVDFIDSAHLNYCSRLTRTLASGTYYIGVYGAFNGGRYRLQARAGS
ncbi:MAG TPA: S8 family serine peptidase [Gemmatimonadales bacterium]|nr:S8 family serine peptidase [Gemmatimonadales bacterium]